MIQPQFDSLQDRIVTANIESVGADYLNLYIPTLNSPARVQLEHLAKASSPAEVAQHYQTHTSTKVFLIRKTQSRWLCSERWIWPQNNPWLSGDIPLEGSVVTGKVVRYIPDLLAVVDLGDRGKEGFLHLNATPGNQQFIQAALEIGDQIQALVKHVDSSLLEINLSINHLPPALPEPPELTEEPSASPTKSIGHWPNLASVHWAVIDDDSVFTDRIVKWFTRYDANIYRVSQPQHLQELINSGVLTHISLDWHLKEFDFDFCKPQRWLPIIKRAGDNVAKAILSGEASTETIVNAAKDLRGQFIAKPVTDTTLVKWLNNEELPPQAVDASGDEGFWQTQGADKAILKRGEAVLKEIISECRCLSAFVALEERPGSYQIRSHVGLTAGMVDAQFRLANTLVSSTIDRQEMGTLPVAKLGALKELAPENAQFALGLPIRDLSTDPPSDNRALILFKASEFSAQDIAQAEAALPRLEHLTELLGYLHAWEEDREVAPMGRMYASMIHEFNNKAQAMQTAVTELEDLCEEGAAASNEWLSAVQSLLKCWQSIERLVQSSRSLIQKDKHHQLTLSTVVFDVVETFKAAIKGSDHPDVNLYGAPSDLRIEFPQLAIEHALLNLLLNAHYHAPKSNAWIELSFVVTPPNQAGQSVHIDVRDNGFGISADQQQSLFKPRQTVKGKQGMGLGLYTSRIMLRAAGGDLLLKESYRYRGSCFRISLPQRFSESHV